MAHSSVKILFSSRGVRIVQFSPATPWPPRHSHAYLIEDEKVVLIDTGIYTDENASLILDYLSHRQIKPEAIFITHGHIDHYGGAGFLQKKLDVPVYVHYEDAHKFNLKVSEALEKSAENMKRFYLSHGVPEKALITSREMLKVLDAVVVPCEEVITLFHGDMLHTGKMNFKVIHVPGHSPGSLIFYDEKHEIVITGDHVLSKKPPTPLIEMTREGVYENSALHYINSLKKLKDMKVSLAFPGHWDVFDDFQVKIDALIRYYRKRSGEALAQLKKAGVPLTAYQLAQKLYPEMPEGVFFIGVSETLGYLSILENEGKVERRIQDSGLVTYISVS